MKRDDEERAAVHDSQVLYTHAERTRVPELMMERLADAAAALDKLGRRDQCRHLMWLHEMLAAAPSQPEGGEVGL